jgi:hypothetical protein
LLSLSPDETAAKLHQLIEDGIIGPGTLIVFDIDDTLFEEASDQMLSGAIPIHPDFAIIINQLLRILTENEEGTRCVAITNGATRLKMKFTENEDQSLPQVRKVKPKKHRVKDDDKLKEDDRIIPKKLRENLDPEDRISWEALRMGGLREVGISFENFFGEFEFFFQSRQVLGTLYATEEGAILPFMRPFPPNVKYIVCAPVFKDGVIFSNFLDPCEHPNAHPNTHYTFGSQKGHILQLFLTRCREQADWVFSDVIFIDDTRACVENVVEVMKKIDMPCIGINILSH